MYSPRVPTGVLPPLSLQGLPALSLLFGEYMNEQLLLRLPHRQFVFTPWSGHRTDLPKVLRVFLRDDRRLHAEISRLIYGLVREFCTEAAGMPIRTAAVVVFQSEGEFSRWNPHWHSLGLQGGFDPEGRFVHVPKVDPARIGYFRSRCNGLHWPGKRRVTGERAQ